MNIPKKILAQTVTQLCLSKGIDHIVISPGSRNAPLTIGFTEHPSFRDFSIVDERCAAFFALGMAQQLHKPVVLVCTSGSALLNYYPAIAEAFYSDIPLVVLSADRPEHLIDVGDGQTIRQKNVFANHILCSVNCSEGEQDKEVNEDAINSALNRSLEQRGPVHINMQFDEPLYEMVPDYTVTPTNRPPKLISSPDIPDLTEIRKLWNAAERKMVLVGVLRPNSVHQEFLNYLSRDEQTIVLTETTSNLHDTNFFPAIDQLIAPLDEEGFKALQPDLLLTFGGMVVSKKIKAFLRKYSPKNHFHIDPKNSPNTYFALTAHLNVDINIFFKSFTPHIEHVKGDYRNKWLKIRDHRLKRHESYLAEIPFSDFKVFSTLFKNLPEAIQLQLANSATIRYAQLYDLHSKMEVFCNRGTSGIDGSTSTALGAAVASHLPTVLFTGDLSFLYDSNALWNNYVPSSFRIVVINNGGGGIFRILPGNKDSSNFSTYFETKHDLTGEYLAGMYGFEYRKANSIDSLKMALNDFYGESAGPRILEIFTPSEVNDRILLAYFDYIS